MGSFGITLQCCVFVLLFVGGSSFLDDPCQLMIVSDLQIHDKSKVNLTIPDSCSQGSVDWHYPCGTLTLYTSKGRLCVLESWSTDVKWVKDVSDGRHDDLPLPAGDVPSCASSTRDKTEMLLHAIDDQLYMTTFKYTQN